MNIGNTGSNLNKNKKISPFKISFSTNIPPRSDRHEEKTLGKI